MIPVRTISVLARHFTGMISIPVDKQQEFEAELLDLLLGFDNQEIRNEIYKVYRIPPFVLTSENEVVFTGECEFYDLD